MQHAAVVLACVFLAGCSLVPAPTETPGVARLITRGQAVAAAIYSASASRPEVGGAAVTPSNVQANLMTLGQAMQRLHDDPSVPAGYDPGMPVWLVTMDGLWTNAAQAPGVASTQVPYHHVFIVLDATTGMEMESSLTP